MNSVLNTQDKSPNSKITQSIDKGVNYLYHHQLPNGEYIAYTSGDPAMLAWTFPDSTLFSTAIICHNLKYISNKQSEKIQHKAMMFLGGEKSKNGLWNHFTKLHIYKKVCPNDIDDTCCISSLYKDKGINFPNPSNIPLIMTNINKKGLFYSWFLFRIKLIRNKQILKIGLERLLNIVPNTFFWFKVEASKKDIDAVVNANALYYLGESKKTLPIIDLIINVITQEKEENCDLWYREPFIVYYFFSRNYYKGILKLEPIVEPIIKRLLSKVKPDGRIGDTILDTAWAICTILNFNYKCDELKHAVDFLIKNQSENGCWPRWIAYWGGPQKLKGWGSEELTTGFCLEAIARYKDFIVNKNQSINY